MYAFEALKAELEQVDELHFIFTSPTFTAEEVTDKIRKERKEFHIPKLNRERNLYGSEFEIHLRNKLTQRAIARECADCTVSPRWTLATSPATPSPTSSRWTSRPDGDLSPALRPDLERR